MGQIIRRRDDRVEIVTKEGKVIGGQTSRHKIAQGIYEYGVKLDGWEWYWFPGDGFVERWIKERL